MGWKIIVIGIFVLAFLLTVMILFGAYRWHSDTKKLQAKIQAARVPISPKKVELQEIEELPEPVQRYFKTVLREGQPLITKVNLEQTGTFNMSQDGEQWKPFKAQQMVITNRPGFVWDARISMAPAMAVHVHDAYIAERGVLRAKLFGLLTVMNQPDSPELAQGELARFLAESAWYPTALLPGQGVVWKAIDDTQASATLTDGQTSTKLIFQFDNQGLISSVRSEERYREVDGLLVATPWQGRFWNYQVHDGMLIPVEGEVAWLLPEGPKAYWRGRIEKIKFEYVQ